MAESLCFFNAQQTVIRPFPAASQSSDDQTRWVMPTEFPMPEQCALEGIHNSRSIFVNSDIPQVVVLTCQNNSRIRRGQGIELKRSVACTKHSRPDASLRNNLGLEGELLCISLA